MLGVRSSVNKKAIQIIRKRAFILCGIIISTLGASAIPSTKAKAEEAGYTIANYQSNVTIEADNVYQVDENITANFTDDTMHGIKRYLPMEMKMNTEINGKKKKATYKIKVDNVNVEDEPFKTDKKDGRFVIKIGDKDTTVSGIKNYHLSYDKSLGNDKFKNADVINYYIVGDSWDCEIKNVNFSITLPKNFDESNLVFRVLTDEEDHTVLNYSVNGRTITGNLEGTLAPYSGFLMQLTLPDGYFEHVKEFTWEMVFAIIFSAFTVFTFVMFLRYGDFKRLKSQLIFYPPEEITLAQAGYISGTPSVERVNALLISWASKGFINIEDNDKKGFCLVKKKELQTTDEHERFVFDQIFHISNRVEAKHMGMKFYKTLDKIDEKQTKLYNMKNLYNDDIVGIQMLVFNIGGVLIIAMMIRFMFAVLNGIVMPAALGIAGAAILTVPYINFWNTIEKAKQLSASNRKFNLLLYGLLSLIVFPVYIIFSYYIEFPLAGIASAISMICTIPMAVFIKEYTPNGRLTLEKMIGFKRFLETSSESQLQQLIATDPSYFYDTLAFAYVFGISKQWAKKFKNIEFQIPEWYRGNIESIFNVTQFCESLTTTMFSIQLCMTSRPQDHSHNTYGYNDNDHDGGCGDGGGDGGGGW